MRKSQAATTDTGALTYQAGSVRLGSNYTKRRLTRPGATRIDCVDYAIHTDDADNIFLGEIRVDKHSSKVVVIRVGVLEAVEDKPVIRPLPMKPVKFSTESDAAQGLKLLREFQLANRG